LFKGGGSYTAATDVICPMYARVPQLQQLAAAAAAQGDPRPVMLCEYAHSMGNSTGNLDAYWRCFEDSMTSAAAAAGGGAAAAAGGGGAAATTTAGGGGVSGSGSNSIIGGFIWDWADQSLIKREVLDGQEVGMTPL
jgi:beta-galactosidase/beta-glucuronidase